MYSIALLRTRTVTANSWEEREGREGQVCEKLHLEAESMASQVALQAVLGFEVLGDGMMITRQQHKAIFILFQYLGLRSVAASSICTMLHRLHGIPHCNPRSQRLTHLA